MLVLDEIEKGKKIEICILVPTDYGARLGEMGIAKNGPRSSAMIQTRIWSTSSCV